MKIGSKLYALQCRVFFLRFDLVTDMTQFYIALDFIKNNIQEDWINTVHSGVYIGLF